MTRPKVLVLLAAFNGSKWILDQVKSILGQVNVDVDLIISDDGSTDETRAIIDGLTADERMHVVSPKTPFGSAAQNFMWLIRSTPADAYNFVSLSDQDDVWQDTRLYRGCAALIDSGAQGYSSAVTAFWVDGRTKVLAQSETPTESDFLFEGAGQGCTYVLDAIFYGRLRKYFIDYESETKLLHYHDWAIYALARSWKLKWIFDQKPTLGYRQHANNDTGARTSMDGIRKRLARIKNGWYAQQLRAIATISQAASPKDPTISTWHQILNKPRGIQRRWQIAIFCSKGGRRRWYDRAILVSVAVAGWL